MAEPWYNQAMLRSHPRLLLALAVACCATAAVLLRDDSRQLMLLRNTLLLAAGSCAISLPMGTALAFLLWRTDVPGRRLALAVMGGLLITPLYLQAAAWDAGWGQLGWYSLVRGPSATPWLSGWHGAVWVHALASVPWVVLLVGAAAVAVEPELEEDALLAGSTWQALVHVTLPRMFAGVAIAAGWVLLATSVEMTVTDLFRVRTYAEELYSGFALGDSPAVAWWMALPGILAGSALVLVAIAAALRAAPALQTPQRSSRCYRLKNARVPAACTVLLCCLLMAGIPLANLVGKAGLVVQQVGDLRVRHWSAWHFFHVIASSVSKFRQELFWTLLIGTLAATCAVTCGAGLAWLARYGGRRAIPALVVAAAGLAIPGPLIGLGVIWLLDREGQGLLVWLYDRTVFAPVLAILVRVLPLAILGCWYVLRSVADDALDCAASEGAGAWTRFRLVALPQRRAGLAAAWLAVFCAAAGDLACSILVVPPGVTTVPVRVFGLIHAGVDDQVAGLCLVVFAGLAAVVVAATWLLQRHEWG